jgi:hypothetical protein
VETQIRPAEPISFSSAFPVDAEVADNTTAVKRQLETPGQMLPPTYRKDGVCCVMYQIRATVSSLPGKRPEDATKPLLPRAELELKFQPRLDSNRRWIYEKF